MPCGCITKKYVFEACEHKQRTRKDCWRKRLGRVLGFGGACFLLPPLPRCAPVDTRTRMRPGRCDHCRRRTYLSDTDGDGEPEAFLRAPDVVVDGTGEMREGEWGQPFWEQAPQVVVTKRAGAEVKLEEGVRRRLDTRPPVQVLPLDARRESRGSFDLAANGELGSDYAASCRTSVVSLACFSDAEAKGFVDPSEDLESHLVPSYYEEGGHAGEQLLPLKQTVHDLDYTDTKHRDEDEDESDAETEYEVVPAVPRLSPAPRVPSWRQSSTLPSRKRASRSW